MAAMQRQHRPAARLRDVAHIEPGPARLPRCRLREFFNEINGLWMAPVAVAAQTHGLPCRARLGQGDSPGKTALGIAAIGRRSMFRSARFCTKKLFCGRALHLSRDALARHDTGGGRALWRIRAPGERQRPGEYGDASHVLRSPSALTHTSSTSPSRKSPITGAMPIRALPDSVVTRPMSAGARNAVARPDRP